MFYDYNSNVSEKKDEVERPFKLAKLQTGGNSS